MWWIVPTAMGLLQTGIGLYQSSQAKREYERLQKEREANRPKMPESAERMVSLAERGYVEGLPMRSQYESELSQRTASSVAAMREGAMTSTEYLQGVSGAYRAELEGLNKIATQEALYRLEQEKQLMGALENKAAYEFQLQSLPYQETMQDMGQAAQSYSEGMQNVWGGIQTSASAVMEMGMQKEKMAQLDRIYGVVDSKGSTEVPSWKGKKTPFGREIFTNTSTVDIPRWSDIPSKQTSSQTKQETSNFNINSSFSVPLMEAEMEARRRYGAFGYSPNIMEYLQNNGLI